MSPSLRVGAVATVYGIRNNDVIPAKAGIQSTSVVDRRICWIPAFAGMTSWPRFLALQRWMTDPVGIQVVVLGERPLGFAPEGDPVAHAEPFHPLAHMNDIAGTFVAADHGELQFRMRTDNVALPFEYGAVRSVADRRTANPQDDVGIVRLRFGYILNNYMRWGGKDGSFYNRSLL
jgi:hypothetical protein